MLGLSKRRVRKGEPEELDDAEVEDGAGSDDEFATPAVAEPAGTSGNGAVPEEAAAP